MPRFNNLTGYIYTPMLGMHLLQAPSLPHATALIHVYTPNWVMPSEYPFPRHVSAPGHVHTLVHYPIPCSMQIVMPYIMLLHNLAPSYVPTAILMQDHYPRILPCPTLHHAMSIATTLVYAHSPTPVSTSR